MEKRNTGTNTAKLIAKLLRDVIRSESFDTLADLVDALKFRCGRLHVRWTPDDISDAIQMVASNRPLVPAARRDGPEIIPRQVGLSRTEAAAILARLGVRV